MNDQKKYDVAGYDIANYVADIRDIVNRESNEQLIRDQVKPLAKRLAMSDEFSKEKYQRCDESQGFGVHLLHEEDNHDLGVFLFSWLPGRGTLPHNHLTWAVVAIVAGQEQERYWRRVDDQSKAGYAQLEAAGERIMTVGDVATCAGDDIHSVVNNGETVSMSLHTYGRHINYTGRSQFDPDKSLEIPFVVAVD